MKEPTLKTRVAMIVDAIGKVSPADSTLGIDKTGRGDPTDALIDAIEDLLHRCRESLTALQSAQRVMRELQIPSDRSAKEELSREQTLLMDALQENLPDTIYFKDAQSRFLHLSKAHAKAFNLIRKEEVVGKTDFDFFMAEHAREAFDDEQKIIRTGIPIINKEEKETWPDRPATWVLTTKMPLRDEHGAIVGTFGISRDITERKRAELALRQETIRRRVLFEEAMDGVVVLGLDLKVIEANRSFATMLGYSEEEVRQLHLWDWDVFFPTEELARAQWPEPPATKGTIETRHRRKDGSIYDAEISFNPAVFSGEKLMYCVCRDITRRKRLEENLEKERSLLLTLINNLPDHVSIKDAESRILITNTANARAMGLALTQDAVGKTDLDLYPRAEAERYLDDEKTVIQTGTALINKEEESSDSEGRKRWTLTTKVPLKDARGRVVGVVCTGRDITERKRAETEIVRANRALRMLSDSNQALIHMTDEIALLTETCRIAVDVGGYRMARVEFVEHDEAKTLRPVAHSGFESGYIDSARAGWTWADNERGSGPGGTAVRTGQPYIARNTLSDPAFEPWRDTAIQRGYRSVVALPLISEGAPLGVLGIYADEVDAFDTEEVEILKELAGDLAFGVAALRTRVKRDQAEAALRESEERYRLIAENTADTIVVSDLAFKPTYVSPSVLRLNGYSVQETMSQSMDQILTPDSLQKATRAFAEQMALEESGKSDPSRTALMELEEYRKDGSTIWVELAASVLRDANLKPIGILSVTRDITKRRKAEAARQLLASAVEQAAEMIIITDAAAVIEYVNPAFITITGYSREEVVGRNARVLKSGAHDAAFYASLWQTISRGETWRGRFVNRKKDGTRYPENATISPVLDSTGSIVSYVAVKHDITREQQLEDQLRQMQKIESVGRLTGGVAHDFNNILQAIIGYSELLSARVSGENKPYVAEIIKAANRAGALTAQLLAFSRKQVLSPRVLETRELIHSIQKMLERVIGEDIELRTSIDPNTGNFLADPGQMEQVLLNLAVNARDAMPSGGTLTIETANRSFNETYAHDHPGIKASEYVCIAVSDTGAGMDQETLSHIYEPFFTTKEVGKGTGLGLSTVYGIVKQSEGYIDCRSALGKGTTFTIYLPLTREEADKPRVAESGTAAPRGTETILIVDDDRAVRSAARIALEAAGYVVIEAAGGEEALSGVRARGLDVALLVTDVVMPRMGGKEMARRLQQVCPKARVLYASGYTGDVISQQGILEAGSDYLQKPFSSAELLTKVRGMLDRPWEAVSGPHP